MSSLTPRVSIIMPAHNHGAYIETALKSVAGQTYPRTELIVIDDGSTDDTAQVIERVLPTLSRNSRTTFYRQENQGLGATLARGLSLATGEFVQFLASDDAIFPDMTARLVLALTKAAPEIAAVGCDGYVFEMRGDPHGIFSHQHPTPFGRNQHREMMVANWLPAMGMLYRRDAIMQEGGIDPDLAYEDWGLLLALTRNHRLSQIPDRLFVYRRHGHNASANLVRMRLALQALTQHYPQMAKARDLRAALSARDFGAVWAKLDAGTLDLALRFALRSLQVQLSLPAGQVHQRIAETLQRLGQRFGRKAYGAGIDVGPGCFVHPTARLVAGSGRLSIGAGCHIGADVRLVAGPGLTIGPRTIIEAGARIGGSDAATQIGEACLIAARTTITAGTTIGDLCVTMPDSQISDTIPKGRWMVPSWDD